MSVPNGHTYLCRRKAAKARFDNRHSTSAPDPTLAPRQRQRRKRYKRSLNRQCYPLHFMREYIPPKLHDLQRAKGPLDRRSKRFSLVPFFLQKKKGTRAGGTKRPSLRPQAQFSPPGESQLAAAAANPHPIL